MGRRVALSWKNIWSLKIILFDKYIIKDEKRSNGYTCTVSYYMEQRHGI